MTAVERLSVREAGPSTIEIDLGVARANVSSYRFSIYSQRDRRYKDTEGWSDTPVLFEPLKVENGATTKLIVRRGIAWGIPHGGAMTIAVPSLSYSEICHWPLNVGEKPVTEPRAPVDPVALMLEELSKASSKTAIVAGAPPPGDGMPRNADEEQVQAKESQAGTHERRYVHLIILAFVLGALASWVWQGPAAKLTDLNFKEAQVDEKRRALEARDHAVAERERAAGTRDTASSQRESSTKSKEADVDRQAKAQEAALLQKENAIKARESELDRQAKARDLRSEEREAKTAERERAVKSLEAALLQRENAVKARESDFDRQAKERETRSDDREAKLAQREKALAEREAMQRPASSASDTVPGAQPISGRLSRVLMTNSLVLEGQRAPLQLAWIMGYGEPHRTMLEKFLLDQGGQLTCDPAEGLYRCYVNNIDVGQAAVMNGAARYAGNAPASYRIAESDARQKRRGIWDPRFGAPPAGGLR
ncbi:hypothetical protein I6F30_35145 [Bradyrhizobium sp. NBAIM20]|uniref:thermonuclease family protein n=1 Tax=unclassified Bradyrhizobium TaxID=2631580 RepID=UPI001CD3CE12|nr:MULTISPECIES: hypothetical protein [unclassified Bradyrhizobium]MCA1416328.1 hypothetical protein [Bradyrhizobium sp. NBAIM20]MCA1466106.1 hypothetical protein [Bradyrhizobium sp. NBAIM18]